VDQYGDPLQGTPVPEQGREADGCWEVGRGKALRALASDSGLENAGVHGRLAQP